MEKKNTVQEKQEKSFQHFPLDATFQKEVISLKYDDVYSFNKGFAAVQGTAINRAMNMRRKKKH
jgi:hypothetical protein